MGDGVVAGQTGTNGDIPDGVVDGMQRHVERDVGKAFEKARHEWREQHPAIGRVRHHAQRTGRRRMQPGDEHLRGIELINDPLGVGIDEQAGRRERNAARGALEHAHTQCLLQVRDGATHGRLGHAQ